MTRLSFRARHPWRMVVALAAAVVVSAGIAVLPPHPAAPAADGFAPPIVNIPKCYPRTIGTIIDCPSDLRNNGWGEGGTSTVVGTAAPGQTYQVTYNPSLPPCASSSQTGCYYRIETYAPGNVYYLKYGASISDQRLASQMTATMSSQEVASWSPGYGICKADWNGVYADGYMFAERAEAARECALEFRYTKADDTQAPLDRLLGPTWVKVSSSISVCDASNGYNCTASHGEGVVTLVRIDGDMWESPVATCQTVSQSGPGGSEIRFDGNSSVNTQLDSVRSWSFNPAGVTVSTSDGYSRHSNTARVSDAPPGTQQATYLLQSWQGSSEAICTATVLPYTPTPTPSPTPTPTPTPTPAPPTTPPPPTCQLSGEPALKGKARVGKKVKVKARGWRVPDADLSYRWKVGGTKTGKDKPRLRLTDNMLGDKVMVIVTAKAPSCERQRVKLNAGKVRSSR